MTIQRNGGKATVRADKRIDANNASRFAAELEAALPGVEDLTLDFSELEYISSSGLRAVMIAAKVMARQGEIRIVNVRENVYDILEATGFTGICDVESLGHETAAP